MRKLLETVGAVGLSIVICGCGATPSAGPASASGVEHGPPVAPWMTCDQRGHDDFVASQARVGADRGQVARALAAALPEADKTCAARLGVNLDALRGWVDVSPLVSANGAVDAVNVDYAGVSETWAQCLGHELTSVRIEGVGAIPSGPPVLSRVYPTTRIEPAGPAPDYHGASGAKASVFATSAAYVPDKASTLAQAVRMVHPRYKLCAEQAEARDGERRGGDITVRVTVPDSGDVTAEIACSSAPRELSECVRDAILHAPYTRGSATVSADLSTRIELTPLTPKVVTPHAP
ncbi:MAG: hypothetical protein ACHREM_18110 [Polyangiales bacterium]